MMEKLSNLFGRMSINGIDQIGASSVGNEDNSKTARRRSLPNINVPVGDENKDIKGMIHFSNDLVNSVEIETWQQSAEENITKRIRKPTEKWLQYTLQVLFDKKKQIFSRLE